MSNIENKYCNGSVRSLLMDVFRIILCIGVVVYHYTPERCSSGPLMVNGFLVMSGFLVGRSLLKSNWDCFSFYRDKIRRLLPMFSIVLFLAIICAVYAGRGLPDWDSSSWGRCNITSLFSHYSMPLWYMGVELTLLLAVPLFYYLIRVNKLHVFLGGVICFTAFLYSRVPDNAPFGDGLYFSTIARCWQFVAGVVVAWLSFSGKFSFLFQLVQKRFLVWITFVVFCIVSIVMMIVKQKDDLNYWNYTFSFDLLTIGFYAFFIPVLYQYRIDVSSKIRNFITNLSELTYPIFLCHVLMYQVCYKIMGDIFGDMFFCSEVMAMLAAIASIIFAFLLLCVQKMIEKRYWMS